MKRTIYAALLALAVAIPLVAIAAAKGGPGEDRGGKGRLFLVLRIADALDLSDEKALAVSRALKQVEERREELRAEHRDLEKEIRAALAEKKPDDAALAKLVERAIELDRRHAKVMQDSFASLQSVLTVQEQAKLVLLRGRMRHEMGHHGYGGWRDGGRRWHRGPDGERPAPRPGPDGAPGPGAPPPEED
jgi:Spy/CpxP family protein refolding chaperone